MPPRLSSIAALAVAALVALTDRRASADAPPAAGPEASPSPAASGAPMDLAPAGTPPVAFGADEVRFDAQSHALEAVGHVHVDEPPFHFTSDALRLRRLPIGVMLDGPGRLAFCQCLGTPLAVRFAGATVAPPHDVILRDPVLEIFGLPVFWLPAFWLRSPGRPGILPPDLAWRGGDGFFAGGGVHLPWTAGDTTDGLDVRAGGYVEGGVAVDVDLTTPGTRTEVRWDRLRGDDGVTIEASGGFAARDFGRGSPSDGGAPRDLGTASPSEGGASAVVPDVGWDVDALRGARAVRATTDVDAVARPFDAAAAFAAWRVSGWTIASGIRTMALRGGAAGDLGAIGPVASVGRGDALGSVGAYDVGIEAGQVEAMSGLPSVREGSQATGATSFARGEGNVLLAAHLGPALASLALRTFGDVAQGDGASGLDGAAEARLMLALPVERSYASGVEEDPWLHRVEPIVEAAAVESHASDVLVAPAGRGLLAPSGGAWVGTAGAATSFGRAGSDAGFEVDVRAGAVGDDAQAVPVLRGRAVANAPWAALRADFARVVPLGPNASSPGGALFAALRVGPAEGLHVAADVAERDGVDPILARAAVDAPYEPASGFLVAPGWTGGARVGIPIGSRITTRAGGDVDLTSRTLVATTFAVELHDPCGCVVLRATGAHRIGRPGADVWVTLDLPLSGR